MSETLLARPPRMSVGESLRSYYNYSVQKWSKYRPVSSNFYNNGSKPELAAAFIPSYPAALATPIRAQQFQILSTAKNIPRSVRV